LHAYLVIAQSRSQAQCWSTLERNTLHSNDSILKDLKRNDIMQNATRFYQKYLRKCLQNKSMLKNATRMCSIFSKCSQRSRNEHGMLGIKPLTTSTGENLEKSMEMDLKSGKGSRILERLDKADDFSLLRLPKRTWGSVFYILNQNADFEILDKIRAKIKDLNINCGEGALTTLIKSYVTRNQSINAVNVLDEMKNAGLLRHTRTYFPIITSLAENAHQNKAFELFDEMHHYTFKSRKSITMSIPPDMTVALIKSCFQSEISEYNKATEVLCWYNHSGQLLTLQILNAIKEWLDNDPVNSWTMKECHISEEGLCNNCGKYLDPGHLTSNEREELKLDILNTMESIFNLEGKAGKRERFCKFVTFLKQCSPCDVIIDGMSIGMSSNVQKQKKRFNFNTLLKVSDHFIQQERKVLVLLNTSVAPSFLSNNVQYFVSDVGDDDLYIMHASAMWNMAPFLVTRDKFREHRFLLAFHNHASYMKWIRSHTIRVSVERDALTFHRQKYDPVVQTGNSSWHFPLVDGSWFCARKVVI
jgi:hypothetical protein